MQVVLFLVCLLLFFFLPEISVNLWIYSLFFFCPSCTVFLYQVFLNVMWVRSTYGLTELRSGSFFSDAGVLDAIIHSHPQLEHLCVAVGTNALNSQWTEIPVGYFVSGALTALLMFSSKFTSNTQEAWTDDDKATVIQEVRWLCY